MSAEYFSAGSSDYARYRPRYPEDWFDWLAAQCAERSLAWDCACGSGQATEELARRFEKVIATDASADQLQNAPLLPNVEWRLASGEASGLDAGSVDVVTVAQALHWLDLPRFWQECYRVLKPEGIIAVWGYGIASLIHPSTNQIFQDFYHGVVGEYWPKERRIVEEGYAGIDFPFQEIPVSAFEMMQSWDVEHLAWILLELVRHGSLLQGNGLRSDPGVEGKTEQRTWLRSHRNPLAVLRKSRPSVPCGTKRRRR